MIWFTATFILLLRHAVFAIPLVLVIYLTVQISTSADKFGMLEIPMLLLTMGVSLVAKARLESSQRETFHFMQMQKQEIVHEKVKRCEAEFATEVLKEGRPGKGKEAPSVTPINNGGNYNVPRQSAGSVVSTAAPSFRSAPGRMWGLSNSTSGGRGDCLPLDCQVWVEGLPLPKKARNVKPGERVLCHDSVVGAPKYVDVLDARCLSGETDWVRIALADGTELTVTANHPVQPKSNTRTNQLPIRATDLEPGVDSLMVLKMVPLIVEEVGECPAPGGGKTEPGKATPTRVALRLQHPQRYEVFVVQGADGAQGGLAAVCSADLLTGSRSSAGGLHIKNTFIDVATEQGGSTRRASSEPPRLRQPAPAAKSATISKREHSTTSPHKMHRTNSDSDIKSRISGFTNMTPSYLDDVVYVQQLGLSSLGALEHARGGCKPCIFQFKFQKAGLAPCNKGVLCEWCHEPHDELPKRARMSGGKRRILAKNKKAQAEQDALIQL